VLEHEPDHQGDDQRVDHRQRDPADAGLADLGERAGQLGAGDRDVVVGILPALKDRDSRAG